MKKIVKHMLPPEKWWNFTLIGVGFFIFFHVVAFGWHKYLVHRYDVLYEQATQEGTLIEMPREFQEAHVYAQSRNIMTRPDILAREAGILQSGIRSLIQQYKNDMYRIHDTIVQDIQTLRTIVEESHAYIFPQRDQIATLADVLEVHLDSGNYATRDTLQSLLDISQTYTQQARSEFELVQKKLLLQDILALKHEMVFLDSFYRFTRDASLVFDYKTIQKNFSTQFTKKILEQADVARLEKVYGDLSGLLDPYRIESEKIRSDARKKREQIVAKEAQKWIDTSAPHAPFPDLYAQIFISLKYQMMYAYEDGELILSTPITSGRRDFETVRGTFRIYTKERNKIMKSPFPDEEYELWVDYWMGFYGAYGIHDACNSTDCWRTRFGGANYVYNGSHGCINTPYNAVRFIYNWAKIGTTVHVR